MTAFSLTKLQSVSDIGLQAMNIALSRVVVLLLLMIIFYYSSTLFWRVFYPQEFRPPVSAVKALAIKPQPQPRWLWFADTNKKVVKKVTQKKLNATLTGVISQGTGKGEGIALIRISGKEAGLFRVGEEVTDGMFVETIGADYVHLERDGETVELRIKKYNVFKDGAVKEESGEVPPSEGEKTVKQFKQAVMEAPTKIMDFVKFDSVEGDRGGFKISPKGEKNQILFDELGLESGDVVVGVDGNKVSELKKNPGKIQQLLKDGVSVTILRDGNELEVGIY